jgi:hypothetical protein
MPDTARLSPAARTVATYLSNAMAGLLNDQGTRDRIADRWAAALDADGVLADPPRAGDAANGSELGGHVHYQYEQDQFDGVVTNVEPHPDGARLWVQRDDNDEGWVVLASNCTATADLRPAASVSPA